jgi:hypothetical protein
MIMLLSGGLYTLAAKASQVLRRRLRGLQRQFYFKRSATLASRRFLPSTGCVLRPLAYGKPIRHRGTFDPEVEYREHDAVLVNGSSFVALRDSPGTCPGSGWQPIAAAGTDGKDGATGPRGERGERGSIGPRGEPAPTITGWRVDRAAYAAVPLLSDGSEAAPLQLRDLFKQFLDEVAPRAR